MTQNPETIKIIDKFDYKKLKSAWKKYHPQAQKTNKTLGKTFVITPNRELLFYYINSGNKPRNQ